MKNKKQAQKLYLRKVCVQKVSRTVCLKEQHDVKVVIMTAPTHATSVNRNDYKIAAANYAEVAN